jgi:hypothetical protein
MSRLGKLMRSLVRQSTGHRPTPTVPAPPTPTGSPQVAYTPDLDGEPDPGEVVWAWVAYEDDPAQGKDRPVLVIGRDGPMLLALQLTSQDHDLDADDEARYGRYWMDIGAGAWDHERRPSEVRLDRLLRLEEHSVRREGAVLDRAVFDSVIEAARAHHEL